jgi:hypothetical protein
MPFSSPACPGIRKITIRGVRKTGTGRALGTPHSADRLYYVGLPVGLKAAQEYALSLPASGFEDEFGRVLPQAIEMKFSTNHRNPNFEMPHKYAVLESQTDSELPFYVNNLESFTFNYRSVTPDGVKVNQTYSKSVQKIEDIPVRCSRRRARDAGRKIRRIIRFSLDLS